MKLALLAFASLVAISLGATGWTNPPLRAAEPTCHVAEGSRLQAQLERFMFRHDSALNIGNLDRAMGFYAEDFASDLMIPVLDKKAMEKVYRQAIESIDESAGTPKFRTEILDTRDFGPWTLGSLRIDITQDENLVGQWRLIVVADLATDPPQIKRLFQCGESPELHISGKSSPPHQNEPYLYQVKLPSGYLVLANQPYAGRFLDRVQLIGEDLSTEISFGLLPPASGLNAKDVLEADSEQLSNSCREYKSVESMYQAPREDWPEAVAIDNRLQVTDHCPLAKRTPGRDVVSLSRAYLSPDGKAVFRVYARSNHQEGPAVRKDLNWICEKLELQCEDPSNYWGAVAAKQGWGNIKDSRFSFPPLELSCKAPSDWAIELLPPRENDLSHAMLCCPDYLSYLNIVIGNWPIDESDPSQSISAPQLVSSRLLDAANSQCPDCEVRLEKEMESKLSGWPATYLSMKVYLGNGRLVRYHVGMVVDLRDPDPRNQDPSAPGQFVWLSLHVRDGQELDACYEAFDEWKDSFTLMPR